MKKIIAVVTLLFAVFLSSNACLNYYYLIDSEGHFHPQPGGITHFDKNFDKEKIVARLKRLEKKLAKEKSYKLLSDYAVGLMKLGKVKESLQILATLYNHYPNEYRLASNLGTAYELNGQPDSALKYIRRGLELNPNDHEGSEWIHVKILETKQQLAVNPNYLHDHTVLQLTATQRKDPKVREQIEIQARERFPFTPGPDPIMGSLMADLGDAYAASYSIEYADAFYGMAKGYFGHAPEQMDAKMADMKKLKSKYAHAQFKRLEEEGEHNRLNGVNYKHILADNDRPEYKIDWTTITTDAAQLLSMVDLTLSVAQIKIADKDTGDGFVPTEDEGPQPQAEEKPAGKTGNTDGRWLYILISAVIVLCVAAYVFLRKNRK